MLNTLKYIGHLVDPDTVYSPTVLPEIRIPHLVNQDTLCGPKGIRNREVPQ